MLVVAVCLGTCLHAAEWQWSVRVGGFVSRETKDAPQAYLWIHPTCDTVRAVVFGQHNMSEETLFENPRFRAAMSGLNVAIVWVTPAFEQVWDERNGCSEIFERIMHDLADASGYDELAEAPVVPVGHSALATFPWNFAACKPLRTLALVSLHGDAPRTGLTGYGGANLDWGATRNIDGIPALMIMGEYEWWDERLLPALEFRRNNPSSCIALFADVGRGHFDVSDRTADYIAEFVAASLRCRLAEGGGLRQVDVSDCVLADRWRREQHGRRPEPASFDRYKGDRNEAFVYPDRKTALRTESEYRRERGKRQRFIGFERDGRLLPYDEKLHARIAVDAAPVDDGVTFTLSAVFTDSLRLDRADERGRISVSRICGPVEVLNDTLFRIRFGRGEIRNPRRGSEIWLLAESDGDRRCKSTVQQLLVRLPWRNVSGCRQTIDFPPLHDMRRGDVRQRLAAVADSGLAVAYCVEEGPAEIEDGELRLTAVPPRAKLPVRVSVTAFQYGVRDSVASAEPVTRTFFITE